MRRVDWSLGLVVLAASYAFAVGCFGSRTDPESLLDQDSGSGGTGGSTSPGPGPVGPGPVGPGAGGFGNDAGGPIAGGFSSVGGFGGFGPGGFGGVPDGGSAGSAMGGAGGGITGTIDCTTDTCSGGEVCCFDDDDVMASFCAAPGSCPASHIQISCQQPSDCPGEICCGIFDFVGGQQGYEEVRCDPACNPPEFDLMGIQMCGAEPATCPGGAMDCVDSATLPEGFNYCQP